MPEQEPNEIRELLEKVDLDNLTLGEIKKISSPALRNALAELIAGVAGGAHHTKHSSHAKHADHLLSTLPV
jgi:hypothetical protein